MRYHPDIHHRRSVRLKDYDYSQAGAYFITICTKNRECLFGSIVNGEMLLSEWGMIVKNEWLRTSIIRPNIVVDEFVLMPNHLHGILVIVDTDCRGTLQRAPTVEQFGKPTSNSMPTIIRLFKSTTTKQINELRKTPGEPLWQRNYYLILKILKDRKITKIQQNILKGCLKNERN